MNSTLRDTLREGWTTGETFSKGYTTDELTVPEQKKPGQSRQMTLRDAVEQKKRGKQAETRPITPKKKKNPNQNRQHPRLNMEQFEKEVENWKLPMIVKIKDSSLEQLHRLNEPEKRTQPRSYYFKSRFDDNNQRPGIK